MLADASSLGTSFTMPYRNVPLTATFSLTTYIAEREVPAIRVYPVPAADIITIEATEVMQNIRIIDMSGRTLSNHIVHDQVLQLKVNHLSSGLYILQVITTDQLRVLPLQVGR
jgi:hypothetical protein